MPLSVSQFIASADTSGEALRLLRAALNLTQADLVARADGAIGADQISLIERGKRPMTSKQCTIIAQALHLMDADRGAAHAAGPDGPCP
jgi:transcriptional regulator with XRE-family HTH domain